MDIFKYLLITLLSASYLPGTAQAASSVNSYAALTYTINSLTSSGDVADVGITGSFKTDADNSYYFGDGFAVLSPGNPDLTAGNGSNFGKTYTQTFDLQASLNDGAASMSYLGVFGLEFVNQSADIVNVEMSLGYELYSLASGTFTGSDYADTGVNLFYFDASSDGSVFTSYPSAILSSSYSNESGASGDDILTGSSGIFSFQLGAFESEGLLAEVVIDASMEASPVPVPGALWLLASAILALPAIRKSKQVA